MHLLFSPPESCPASPIYIVLHYTSIMRRKKQHHPIRPIPQHECTFTQFWCNTCLLVTCTQTYPTSTWLCWTCHGALQVLRPIQRCRHPSSNLLLSQDQWQTKPGHKRPSSSLAGGFNPQMIRHLWIMILEKETEAKNQAGWWFQVVSIPLKNISQLG